MADTTTEAGRELDQRIAIEVMGWGWMTGTRGDVLPFKRWLVPPEEFGDWGHVHPADLSLPEEHPWWLEVEPIRVAAEHKRVPRYSTDIAAAWTVVEKVRDTTDGDETWVSVFDDGANGWRCVVLYNLCAGKDAPVDVADELADTAPLAICRAALIAVAAEAPR